MKKKTKKAGEYYYINNICDHNIRVAGEILIVMDDQYAPFWHYDWSDGSFDFPDSAPRDLLKITGVDAVFKSVRMLDRDLAANIEGYLDKHGYPIEED